VNRVGSMIGSAIFLVVTPGTVAVLVPRWICDWQLAPPLLAFSPFRGMGVLLVCAGVPVLLDSFIRFALQGVGTPAPVAPTRHLVVTGLYRRVRNPMYVAVVSIVVGQGLFFASVHVLEYGLVLWLVMHLFVVGYEEPTLRETFGTEYEQFCAEVHRWRPRLKPWRPRRPIGSPFQ
jgi:protein-S-isoprenylcysteine O-methyltransferase Ste14